jgi:hypothetical protein
MVAKNSKEMLHNKVVPSRGQTIWEMLVAEGMTGRDKIS